jgi:hypothetical protein
MIPSVKPAVLINDLISNREKVISYAKQNYYWTGSGSAAIYLAINATSAKTIAIPAFTCSIVPDAVKKTGATIQFYDSGIVATLSDVKTALSNKPDMIILSYNFGLIPDDLQKILAECRKKKVLVLEDCAHAFGFGQNADFTIYSCGIAKSLSYYGGFLLSKKQRLLEQLPKLSLVSELQFFIKGVFSQVIFSPEVYGLLNKVIFRTIDQYPKAKLYSASGLARRVIYNQIARYADIQKIRNRNFKLASKLKAIVSTKQKSNLYLVLQTKQRARVIKQFYDKNVEVLPAKSFFNLAGKGFPKAKQAEEQHLVFSLYRSEKEMEVFVDADKNIKR